MSYIPIDVLNGKGTRCTLFVSGCVHKCEGCHNKSSWNRYAGCEFTKADEDRIIKDLKDELIPRTGLSISGGDPLYTHNVGPLTSLINRVKAECPDKDIWLWSGYTLEELKTTQDVKRLELIKLVDVFIDGKFDNSLKDIELPWRGSSNQKLIQVATEF